MVSKSLLVVTIVKQMKIFLNKVLILFNLFMSYMYVFCSNLDIPVQQLTGIKIELIF